jgi:hypothetical protein
MDPQGVKPLRESDGWRRLANQERIRSGLIIDATG